MPAWRAGRCPSARHVLCGAIPGRCTDRPMFDPTGAGSRPCGGTHWKRLERRGSELRALHEQVRLGHVGGTRPSLGAGAAWLSSVQRSPCRQLREVPHRCTGPGRTACAVHRLRLRRARRAPQPRARRPTAIHVASILGLCGPRCAAIWSASRRCAGCSRRRRCATSPCRQTFFPQRRVAFARQGAAVLFRTRQRPRQVGTRPARKKLRSYR